ncbi:MAG: hypothetical protein WC307_07115 [Candidatus Nanoarchaeia archaeon]|jgi:hypothetical protein
MVGLLCSVCYALSPKGSISKLVDAGWYWCEFTLENGGKHRCATCPKCAPSHTDYFRDELNKINKSNNHINSKPQQSLSGVEGVERPSDASPIQESQA